MTTAQLTPVADQTPAVAEIHNELSGKQWVSRFPGTNEISDLEPTFQEGVKRFIAALKQAGAEYRPTSTYRPPERAYLMHWSWLIWHKDVDASDVPPMEGVYIEWVHSTPEESYQAAEDMVIAYGTKKLKIPPQTKSQHTKREAIDMVISWSGVLNIVNADGNLVEITTTPRNEMNSELHKVAETYGVIKYRGGYDDPYHWSTTGG
jgi:hypothetical protein